MRKQTKWYLALGVLGLVLAAASLLLEDAVPRSVGGMLMGAGAGLFALGLSMFHNRRWEEKDPARMKQARIEANDERNMTIRNRAAALAGEVLQWAVLAASWVAIGLDAPLWVTLSLVGAFVLKSVLELFLMVKYQREM